MFDFIQKIIYSFLAFQEKTLTKKLSRNFKSGYSNSTTKKFFGQAASLELNSLTDKNKSKLQLDVKSILKKYSNNPDKLLEFVKRSGTKVYRLPLANSILKIINHEEGFLGETSGIKALYLNIVIPLIAKEPVQFSLKSAPMFVLRNSTLDNYCTIQQFHKWYAMKLKLPGFNAEAQNNFQKYMNSDNADINSLSVEEILDLKEAIARDVEAINFIVDLAKATAGSKNALQKMTAGGATV